MANGKIRFGKQSGGQLALVMPDGVTNTEVVFPEEGILATKQYVDDNVLLSPNDSRAKTALNASGTAPIYACRAWVNFNSTGTVAIRASGNVSSITDNGVGDYTTNFTTAMPDDNYVASGIHNGSQQNCNPRPISVSTSTYRFATTGGPGTGAGVSFNPVDPVIVTMEFTR